MDIRILNRAIVDATAMIQSLTATVKIMGANNEIMRNAIISCEQDGGCRAYHLIKGDDDAAKTPPVQPG